MQNEDAVEDTMSPEDAARFRPLFEAFLARDPARLDAVLSADPDAVDLRMGGNTLLELATQPSVGGVDPAVIAVLVRHGASLDRALNLAACFNLASMVDLLLDAGADPTARADANITPLESAAMHGSTEAADRLVAHGVHRNGLWLAAATGQLERVRSWVGPNGALRKDPGAYRPNFADVGRPEGEPPSDDPDEILGEALVFAAANGRALVVDYLLGAGVSVDARPYRNTTGLHLAIQFGKRDMVAHLLRAGASTSILDGQYNSDAHGWARACDGGDPTGVAIRALLQT